MGSIDAGRGQLNKVPALKVHTGGSFFKRASARRAMVHQAIALRQHPPALLVASVW